MDTNSVVIHVLDQVCLSDFTGLASATSSEPVAVPRNRVVLSATLLKGVNSGEFDGTVGLQLEGTYDGRAWLATGLPRLNFTVLAGSSAGPEEAHTSKTAVDFAFLRVRATVAAGGSGTAKADASLSFSDT